MSTYKMNKINTLTLVEFCVQGAMTDLLKLIFIAVHNSDSQDELLGIVVVEDTVQVITETLWGIFLKS